MAAPQQHYSISRTGTATAQDTQHPLLSPDIVVCGGPACPYLSQPGHEGGQDVTRLQQVLSVVVHLTIE